MFVDKGLNHRWARPANVRRLTAGSYQITLQETLGQPWPDELVGYPLPKALRGQPVALALDGQSLPCQVDGERVCFRVSNLAPHETRRYALRRASATPPAATTVTVTTTADSVLLANELIALRLPASQTPAAGAALPGPLLAVRRGDGPWLGQGKLESPLACQSIGTAVTAQGPLWTEVTVTYRFAEGAVYTCAIRLAPGDHAADVREDSTLPSRLWPAPRPYREIGSLGKSFWDQPLETLARPCIRPSPTSNFRFDLRAGLEADRLQTHSTAAWEIMDMPLRAPSLKAYTAMRASYVGVDAGWLGCYATGGDTLVGVASLDLAGWRLPDDTIHPVHRTPGFNAEVILLDDSAATELVFPVESLSRHWLLVVVPRYAHPAPTAGKPLRLDGDPDHPIWYRRRRRGDLSLDKTKDWVVDWPDTGLEHPRALCTKADFPAIRAKVARSPELRDYHAATTDWRPADNFMLHGTAVRLAEIEAITHGEELVENILARGYTGPVYAIGLARPIRRYALACDTVWDSFTPEEQRHARRVLALATYILTDGDWWQYAYRPGETTYLPNFNTDVFACAVIIGLILGDHPNTPAINRYAVRRCELEFTHHLRTDGGGEENLGSYLMSTWTQLYMPMLWALRHCGVKDYSADPRIRAGGRFMLDVFGPPDARDAWLRQTPPIGHHPHVRKNFGMMAWLASFVKAADPELASNLMWAWRQSGAPVHNLYDHSGPKANPLTRQLIFHDDTIPERCPVFPCRALPHVGAVIRTHGDTRQGSFLLLKAGRVHSHHDNDEGSFHYYGRGIPLALDGLRLENGATEEQHNAITFGKYGQPSGVVEHFASTPRADYVRAVIAPRAFCTDSMYLLDTHRSGWTRELLLVKSPTPGSVEYLVVKDTAVGPEPAQWNLDVLTREPRRLAANHWHCPGHEAFRMGLDVLFAEPASPTVVLEAGAIAEALRTPAGRAELPAHYLRYDITEHWHLHVPAGPGTTFVAVLFPRPPEEMAPRLEYLEREETLAITHAAGRDLIFLRPNPVIALKLDGVRFRGRAGLVADRADGRHLAALDAAELHPLTPGQPGYTVL